MGPRVLRDACGKSRFPPGFERRTVQPVASRYADGLLYSKQVATVLCRSLQDI